MSRSSASRATLEITLRSPEFTSSPPFLKHQRRRKYDYDTLMLRFRLVSVDFRFYVISLTPSLFSGESLLNFDTNRKKQKVYVRAGFSSGRMEICGGGGGGVGCVWGGWNIRNRLAASSLVTKIHAGQKLPRPSCRNEKQGGRHLPSLCVSSASPGFTVPARPVPTHPRTPTTDLGTGHGGRGGGSDGMARGTQSRMQIPNHSFK